MRSAVRRWRDTRALDRVRSVPHLRRQILREAPPRWIQLRNAATQMHTDAVSVLHELFPAVTNDELDALLAEYETVAAAVTARGTSTDANYPDYFTIEAGTAKLLYIGVRLTRPTVALETGVADGRSTAVVLAAMEANGVGTLHSIDIDDNVGALVADRSRWNLHVIDPAGDDFERVAASVGRVDFFLHDGDHSYDNQLREYQEMWPRLNEGGLFVSDDADWSWAAIDFFRSVDREWVLLHEARKALAVTLR